MSFSPYILLHNLLFTVEMADQRTCQRSDHVRITSTAGYIASVVSEETGCGTGQTPWIIEEQEGQRINITLIDFNVYENGKVGVALLLWTFQRRISKFSLYRRNLDNYRSTFKFNLVQLFIHKTLLTVCIHSSQNVLSVYPHRASALPLEKGLH